MKRPIEITINGESFDATVEHRLLLVDFIRDVANLTGTHVGCGFEGRCGAMYGAGGRYCGEVLFNACGGRQMDPRSIR